MEYKLSYVDLQDSIIDLWTSLEESIMEELYRNIIPSKLFDLEQDPRVKSKFHVTVFDERDRERVELYSKVNNLNLFVRYVDYEEYKKLEKIASNI